jgi:hypothetical protein
MARAAWQAGYRREDGDLMAITRHKLVQLGYVTRDMEAAVDHWVTTAGAGPFYYADYEPERQMYRGQPTQIRFRVAYGFLGDVHIEVIQQLEGGASAYTEALEQASSVPVGGLFHHMLFLHDGYDASSDAYLAAGATPCYSAFVEGVGRFCYLDARPLTGCFVEFVEDTSFFEACCVKMREAHLGWDGRNPRRTLDEVIAQL